MAPLVVLFVVSLTLSPAAAMEACAADGHAGAAVTCVDSGDKVAATATNSIIQGRVDVLAGVELKVHPNSDVAKTGRGEWIVWPGGDCGQQDLEALSKNMPNDTRAVLHGHPEKGGLCFFVMEGTREGMRQKLEMHRWDSTPKVETDTPVHFDAQSAQESSKLEDDAKADVLWNLDRIDDKEGLDGSFEPMSKTGGKGVKVYVVDTGIHTAHEEFGGAGGGRAVPALETVYGVRKECSANDQDCAADGNGHGTFCAAVVGGKTFGVAKQATLHAVKVLDSEPGKSNWLLDAFDWLLSQNLESASTIFSVSLSLGGGDGPFLGAMQTIVESGVTLVVAGGNRGLTSGSSGWPGGTGAIRVGATTERDTEYIHNVCCNDIYAPGQKIKSAWSRPNWPDGMKNQATRQTSGSSAACPHVAGAAALLLAEAHRTEHTFPPGGVKKTLLNHGTKFLGEYSHKILLYIGEDSEGGWLSEAEAGLTDERTGTEGLPSGTKTSDLKVKIVLR